MTHGKQPISSSEIAHSFVLIDEEYSEPNEIENLLPVLSERGILYAYDDRFAETYYLFTDTGEKYYLEQIQNQNSVVHRFKYLGKPWLTSAFERKQRQAIPIENETSDAAGDIEDSDEWEPLPIDRTTSEYKNIVEAVNDAIEKIEADNGYAANKPEERDNVVWSLRQGIAAIREMAPSLAHVRALIMAPLNSAIKTLKESVLGVAAMVAREAFKEWIKSLFR